jgi:transposase
LGRQSKYPEEFRRQAASLVVDGGRGVRDVARELDKNHETLRNWVGALRRERTTPGGRSAGDERAE